MNNKSDPSAVFCIGYAVDTNQGIRGIGGQRECTLLIQIAGLA